MSNVKKNYCITLESENGNYTFQYNGSDKKETSPLQNQGNPEPFSLNDMNAAEKELKHTINQSRDIVGIAEQEAQRTLQKAKDQGYAQGYEEGFRQGAQESIRHEVEKKQTVLNSIAQFQDRVFDFYRSSADSDAQDLIFALTENLIMAEIENNDEAVYQLYKKAANHIGRAESAALKVGPRGFKTARENIEKFKGAIDGLQELEIIQSGEDNGLCILETPVGNVDTSARVQLTRARKILNPEN